MSQIPTLSKNKRS